MKKTIELAKQALMEKRSTLASQMAECDEAYKTLDKILDKELEKEKQPPALKYEDIPF